jgi:starch synthase
MVDVGDVEGLAERMEEIAGCPALARRYGQAGRDRAIREFSTDKVVPRYEGLYDRIVRKAVRKAGTYANA